MKTKYIIQLVFGLLLVFLGNGCATKALWENGNLEAWNQPATNPNLRLFVANQKDDLLVIYDEYSDRSDTTHTRAYWMKKNQKLIDQRNSPHFITTNTYVGFTALPVFPASTNQINSPPPYAIVTTNGQSFTLHLDNGSIESHDLPCYNDQKGKVEKFALTPLTAAADITIVGGVFGYWYLYGLASSGYNHSY